MKITAGICSLEQARCYAGHGADEFYCGFSGLPNYKASSHYNVNDSKRLETIIAFCRKAGKPIHIALNTTLDSEKSLPGILKEIAVLEQMGASGFIVKDIALMSAIKESGLNFYVIASHLCQIFNSESLKMHTRAGAARVVWPQQLLPGEAKRALENSPRVETEIFYLPYYYCRNVDGVCRLHDGHAFQRNQATKRIDNNMSMYCALEYSCNGDSYRLAVPPLRESLRKIWQYHALGTGYLKLARRYYPEFYGDQRESLLEAVKIIALLDRRPALGDFLESAEKMARPLYSKWNKRLH